MPGAKQGTANAFVARVRAAHSMLLGREVPASGPAAGLTARDAEKKAKALFRRAQAQRDGHNNSEEALKDLRKALKLAPDDKAIQQAVKILELECKSYELHIFVLPAGPAVATFQAPVDSADFPSHPRSVPGAGGWGERRAPR